MPSGAALASEIADPKTGKRSFRPDIQGLRAIAVLAVIADHLFKWPAGGFVGVDVFFVISGFLITSHLVREHNETGGISFTGFYWRRAKRLLPAATIVLVFVVGAAYLLFNRARFIATVWDTFWASIFVANWNFAVQGTDYFGASAVVSPLQHFWSLAVEEQFYFVWPWLMVLTYFLVTKISGHRRKATGAVLTAIIVVSVASLGWSMIETTSNPTWAYFSTFSRAWELGIGAIIAVAAAAFTRMPNPVRTLLALVGLAGIVVSLFIVPADEGFPAPWALLPVLSTAMVIVSGIGGDARFVWPLTNPVAGYVGNISYSLYLWHWPLIVFAGVLLAEGSIAYFAVVLVATAVMSVLSYHFVEQTTRRWQIPQGKRSRRRHKNSGATPVWQLVGVSVLAVVSLSLSALALAPRSSQAVAGPQPVATFDFMSESDDAPADEDSTPDSPSQAMIGELASQISVALDAGEWPALTPSLDEVIESNPGAVQSSCFLVDRPGDASECSWGNPNAETHIVLVGDSMSGAYTRSFQDIAERRDDVLITTWAMNGCRFSTNAYEAADPAVQDACPGRVADAISYINTEQPTAVVVTNHYGGSLVDSGEFADDAQWAEGLRGAVSQIAGAAGKIVFLTSPPLGTDPAECYTPMSSPADCVSNQEPGSQRSTRMVDEAKLAAEVGGIQHDTAPLTCVGDGCPAFVGTVPVRRDGAHISGAYASYISPIIEQTLADDGVLPPTN